MSNLKRFFDIALNLKGLFQVSQTGHVMNAVLYMSAQNS